MFENKEPLFTRHNIQLQTITPLHIATGENLSPLGDYAILIEEGEYYFYKINEEKFTQAIAQQNKTQSYVDAVIKNKGKNNNSFLEDFIEHNLAGSITDYIDKKTRCAAKISNHNILVGECIKTANQPYIPGSTLKGAIRHAILCDWLMGGEYVGKPSGEKELSNLLNLIKHDYNFGRLMSIEEKLWGKTGSKQRLPASLIQIEDTTPFTHHPSKNVISLYDVLRFHLKNESDAEFIYLFKEAVTPKSTATTRVTLHKSLIETDAHSNKYKTRYEDITHKLRDFKELAKMLNRFALANLKYEVEELKKPERYIKDELSDYINFINQLTHQIKEEGNETTAFIRLGQGKILYHQIIAHAIFKWAKNNDPKMENKYKEYLNKEAGNIFPVTRTLTNVDLLPLGWVKITLSKTE